MTTERRESSYTLQVKLLELRATDPKTIRLYQKPSEMTMFPESTLIENPEELLKYGISERRVGINRPIHKEEHEGRVSSNFTNLEDDKRYATPDFISNQNSLKYLMTPDGQPQLFKATRCPRTTTIDIRIVQSAWHSEGFSTGEVMERMISFKPETDKSQQLHGQFHASLAKIGGDDEITLAYTAQLDGLEYSEEREARLATAEDDFRFTAEDLASVVKVKSITTKKLCSTFEDYFYEHKFLRQNWAQCRLTGLNTVLCGIVGFDEDDISYSDDNLKLKEIWNCDVNKMPEIIQRIVPSTSTEDWQRLFPCSILTTSEMAKFKPGAGANLTPWSEHQILREFHAALSAVKDEMRSSAYNHVKYFIYTNNDVATGGGRLMKPMDASWDEPLDRINFSIRLRIPGESQAEARNSVRNIISGLAASEDQSFGFLWDWLENEDSLMLRRQGSNGHFLAKLDFQSQEDATKILKAVEIQGIRGFYAHKPTLEHILRRSF